MTLVTHAKYLYEWDSANYALGAQHFDVFQHQPHPPGYPVWIALIKGLAVLGFDANSAQITLAALFGGAAFLVFWQLGERLLDHEPSRVLASLGLVMSPPALLYGAVASNYTADLFLSACVGLLAVRMQSRPRLAPFAAGLLALGAGVRASGAMLLAPLLGVAIARACRRHLWTLALSAGVAVATVAAWYVPTATLHGGIRPFQEYSSRWAREYFHWYSVFFGAPEEVHVGMIENDVWWLILAIGAPLAVAAALKACSKALHRAPVPREHRKLTAFYALWLAPNLAYVFALHSPKPGYLLLSLPPLVLLIGHVADQSVGRILKVAPSRGFVVSCAVGALIAASSLTLASLRYGNHRLHRSSLSTIRDSDTDTGAVLELARNRLDAATDCVIIDFGPTAYGPSFRTLSYYLPGSTLYWFEKESHGGQTVRGDPIEKEVPEAATRLLLLQPSAGWSISSASIEQSVPRVRKLYVGNLVTVWGADLGQDVDLRFSWASTSLHLTRGRAQSGVSRKDSQW